MGSQSLDVRLVCCLCMLDDATTSYPLPLLQANGIGTAGLCNHRHRLTLAGGLRVVIDCIAFQVLVVLCMVASSYALAEAGAADSRFFKARLQLDWFYFDNMCLNEGQLLEIHVKQRQETLNAAKSLLPLILTFLLQAGEVVP